MQAKVSISFLLLMLAAPTIASAQIYVRLLGTAGPSLSSDVAEAGLLVVAGSEVLLFDCGRGVPERLAQLPGRIGVNKVFLTHLHSDHTEGLPVLWMNENTWSARGNTPLSVWGPGEATDQPSGTADLTSHLATAYATNTHIRRDLVEHLPAGGIQIQTTEIPGDGVVYQNNGVTVTAFLVDHGPLKPAFGYRVDYQGHSVVFSGDTTFTPNLVQHAQGADVLIHEVLIPIAGATPNNDAILAYHSTPEQAASVFTQVSPRLAIYTHIVDQIGLGAQGLIDRTRAAGYTGPLQVGRDLSLIEIGDTIQVLNCPSTTNPSIAAITNATYQSKVSAGGTVILWGSNFSIGGNSLFWTRAGTNQSVILGESDGLYFWDQSNGQINAALPPAVTPGLWYVQVQSGCVLNSGSLAVTVN